MRRGQEETKVPVVTRAAEAVATRQFNKNRIARGESTETLCIPVLHADVGRPSLCLGGNRG